MKCVLLRMVLGFFASAILSGALLAVFGKKLTSSTSSSGVDGAFMLLVTLIPAALAGLGVAGGLGVQVLGAVGLVVLVVAGALNFKHAPEGAAGGATMRFGRWLLVFVLGPGALCGALLAKILA